MSIKPCLFVITAAILIHFEGATAYGQTPNTAALVVAVSDGSGAPVAEARISVASAAIGSAREVASGRDGWVTIPALPVCAVYSLSVAKAGFATEGVTEIALRAGETATVGVRLIPIGGTSDVVTYGTATGVCD